MLLRICLIIAIVGGLAAATVNILMVQKVIVTTIAERDQQKSDKEAAQADASKTHKELASTKTKLDATNRQLTQTKNDLDAANGKVSDLEKKTSDLTDQLHETQAQRDKSDQELSKWQQLNVTPAQVVQIQSDLKKTITERDGVIAENKLLNSKLKSVQDELADVLGKTEIPVEPTGLKGKIVAVDPKYDFVILDIGDDKGVVPRGILMIARDGKLIGKIQIARVDKNQSVGTLIPNWSMGDVMEGDQVLD